MKKAVIEQYSSEYGFKSPGFLVDDEGNITATSISLTNELNSAVVDYRLTDEDGAIIVSGLVGTFPNFDIFKSRTITLELSLDTRLLYFYKEDKTTLYNATNLVHSSGDSGLSAQGKSTGLIELTVSPTYDQSVIYYTDQEADIFGTITINDPIGTFGSLSVTSALESTSSTTGSLTVAGGVGIAKTLNVGVSLNTPLIESQILSVSEITSTQGLTFEANPQITVLGTDSSQIGIINDIGSTIPVVNTTIKNSVINGTTIGLETPAAAEFTEAKVEKIPIDETDISNKSYVDITATALSIALGS